MKFGSGGGLREREACAWRKTWRFLKGVRVYGFCMIWYSNVRCIPIIGRFKKKSLTNYSSSTLQRDPLLPLHARMGAVSWFVLHRFAGSSGDCGEAINMNTRVTHNASL